MPQLEDGYIRIADELLEALMKIRISGEARQIFDSIMRKTYGWQKKWDTISLSQFEEMTGISRSHIIRARKKLLDMNLIIAKKGNDSNVSYSIQKNYKEWKPLPKKATLPKKEMLIAKKGNEGVPKKAIDITQKGNGGVPKKGHTKDTNTKDTTKDTLTKDKGLSKPTKRKIKKPTNPNVKLFIDGFYNSFKEKTGAPYLVVGKDGALIKRLLGTYSLEELQKLKDLFFNSTDEFIVKAGYSIGIFSSQINKLISGSENSRHAGIKAWGKKMEEKVRKEEEESGR